MASGGGSPMPGRDLAWKYSSLVEGNINRTICNLCGLLLKSGGIMRFKFHLTYNDPHNNTKKCPRVPPEVKEEIRLMVHDKNKAKVKKTADIQEICAQLRGTMWASDTHLIDEDVEDEVVYMYLTNMHPNKRDAYQSVVCASKVT